MRLHSLLYQSPSLSTRPTILQFLQIIQGVHALRQHGAGVPEFPVPRVMRQIMVVRGSVTAFRPPQRNGDGPVGPVHRQAAKVVVAHQIAHPRAVDFVAVGGCEWHAGVAKGFERNRVRQGGRRDFHQPIADDS